MVKGLCKIFHLSHSGRLNKLYQSFIEFQEESTQSKGVVPDIALPSLINLEEVGENQKEVYTLGSNKWCGSPTPSGKKSSFR